MLPTPHRLYFLFTLLLMGISFFPQISSATWPDFTPQYLPDLLDLEDRALRLAGLDPHHLDQWERGARWAPALPRLQVGWESNFLNQNTTVIQDSIAVNSSGVTVGPSSNRLDADLRSDRGLEVRALWNLEGLLFNPDQILISREARDLFAIRGRLRDELHQAYFSLQETLSQFQTFPQSRNDLYLKSKAQKAVARLNSLTGGEFLRMWKNNVRRSPNS